MFARLPGPDCSKNHADLFGDGPKNRTPGPLGVGDAHDPSLGGELGDTPGPLGCDDFVENRAETPSHWIARRANDPESADEVEQFDMTALRELVLRFQGKERAGSEKPKKPVKDSRGATTMSYAFDVDRPDAKRRIEGLGLDYHLVKAKVLPIPERQLRQLFDEDLQLAIGQARTLVKTFRDLPEKKQQVVITLVFWQGKEGFAKHQRLIERLEARDFWGAGEEIKVGRWSGNLEDSAAELAAMMQAEDLPNKSPLRWSPRG